MGAKKPPKRKYVTPNCCKEARDNPVVTLILFDKNDLLDSVSAKPRWGSYYFDSDMQVTIVEAKYCQFCGKPLPKIRKRQLPAGANLCTITDGGIRCDTCGKRLPCDCLPPCFAWEPHKGKRND